MTGCRRSGINHTYTAHVPDVPSTHQPARTWLVPVIVFAVTLMVYASSLSTPFKSSDAVVNGFAAWHLAETGSPYFDDVDVIDPGGPDYFGPNKDGHIVISRTPGQIWAAVPIYLMLPSARFTNGPASIAAAFYTAIAVLLIFLALRRLLGVWLALGFTGVFAFATPVWSVSAETLLPHCITVLGLAGAVLALSRGRLALAGLSLGVAILARPHIALVALVVGVGLAWSRRSLRPLLSVGLSSAVMMGVLLVWNRAVFGRWSVTSGYGQTVAEMVPGARPSRLDLGYGGQILGYLISPDKGLLVWTPLVLVLLPVAIKFRGRVPDWAWCLALGGVAYSIVQTALNEFTGGDGFNGYRLALEPLVCLVPLLALAATSAGPRTRRLAFVATVYQAGMIAVATYVNLRVLEQDVWRDNSTLLALREEPVTAVTCALAAMVLATVIWRLVAARAAQEAPGELGLVIRHRG